MGKNKEQTSVPCIYFLDHTATLRFQENSMKYLINGILIIVFILSGCATRAPSESIFNKHAPYQTPDFSIGNYKSPELRSSKQMQDISVAVAISGGGHRAGNYGIGVLKELEDINCQGKIFNVLREVDYLSTVSGGGLAAGIYISTLYDHIQNGKENEYSLSKIIVDNQDGLERNLERGYHNDLTRALVNLKSLGNMDRGDFLEEEFDNKFLGYMNRKRSLTLGAVFVSDKSTQNPIVPMWVTNATVYENGSIFPFHPLVLKEYEVTQYTHHLNKLNINGDYYSMPLSVGLKASASFPGAVPATTLKSTYDPKNSFLHLFDGGLSDNLGINSAMRMLSSTGDNKKVFIIIDAYNGQTEPFSKQEGSPIALQIFLRTSGISLDAWRIRHKLLVEQLSSSSEFNGEKVKVIYLTLDDLSYALKNKVMKIGTNFNISKTQQATLFEAAKEVVTDNKNDIIHAIYGERCTEKL
jgi:predicted acylesterase/phospholipase RssA